MSSISACWRLSRTRCYTACSHSGSSNVWPTSTGFFNCKGQSVLLWARTEHELVPTKKKPNYFHPRVLTSSVDQKPNIQTFHVVILYQLYSPEYVLSCYVLFLVMKWPKSDDELVHTMCHPVVWHLKAGKRRKSEQWTAACHWEGQDMICSNGDNGAPRLSLKASLVAHSVGQSDGSHYMNETEREEDLKPFSCLLTWSGWSGCERQSWDWNGGTYAKLIPTSVGGICRAADSSVNFNPSDLDRPR